ncbi:MAG: FkbM family methyltransferase [Anaerolineales bacterium]
MAFIDSFIKFISRILPIPAKRAIYRVPWLANVTRRTLNQLLPQGLTEIEITAGLLQGYTMSLDLQQEKDYWLGTYEVELQNAIRDFVKPGLIAYDVGANVGYITLMLAHQVSPAGQVFAFEPLPQNINRLRHNIDINQLSARVRVYPLAVVDRPRPIEFLAGPSDDMGKVAGSAGRQNIAYSPFLSVNGISLDEFVFQQDNPAPDVVKMDIEGGEILALEGMRRLLTEKQPLVLLELHGEECARFAWEIFHQAGYRLNRMHHGYPHISTVEDLNWKSYIVAFPVHYNQNR